MPEFFTAKGRRCARIRTEQGTSLYGTGEIAGPLLRNGKSTQTWNTDAIGYGPTTRQLYQSHPWVLAVRANGTSYGVLANTTWRCDIDLRKGIEFRSTGPEFDLLVIDGFTPQQVIERLAQVIGTMPLPPLWALGYHQCRWSYYPDTRVREIADEFRTRAIPCDVIWMDIDYMDGFRVFTFDVSRFRDPAALNRYLHEKGFRSVWMIDPGVKAEKGYFVFDQGSAGNHWVRCADGTVFRGKAWPGACVFPDFTRPDTRTWWSRLYKDFVAKGIDGVWNDMNEPSVNDGPDGTMPEDNLHSGGGSLPPGTHAQYHNAYGMLMSMGTREGLMESCPEKRPFLLTRSTFMGGHRYAATWTGDNKSSWEDLRWSIPMTLNLGLSGQPFCGPDIGGFSGDATAELFSRWIGVGAFFPFCRGHTARGTRDHEPWAFGADTENTARTALQRRYRLLPYIYTLFYEASQNGMPVMRPVFFADPADPRLRDEDQAFLLGADLLVVPFLWRNRGSHSPKEPSGIWREVRLVGEAPDANPCRPGLKIRGGAIIPAGPLVENTVDYRLDPLTLLVCLDKKGVAEGCLYEDDGEGYGYREGDYLLTAYRARLCDGTVGVSVVSTRGDRVRPDRKLVVSVLTDHGLFSGEGCEDEGIRIPVS